MMGWYLTIDQAVQDGMTWEEVWRMRFEDFVFRGALKNARV
jgi:hypothetical protein